MYGRGRQEVSSAHPALSYDCRTPCSNMQQFALCSHIAHIRRFKIHKWACDKVPSQMLWGGDLGVGLDCLNISSTFNISPLACYSPNLRLKNCAISSKASI